MKLIANRLNSVHLRDILPSTEEDVDIVYGAIAYGSSSADQSKDLIGNCITNKTRLDLWMRYDHTVPVSIELLKRILKNHKNNIFCNLIPDYLHSKVIWWKGYGAYIGSANHTDRGWLTNIEVGVFFTENDLQEGGLDLQLDHFFDQLRALDVTFPLSNEVIEEQEQIQALRASESIEKKAKKLRRTKVWEGPSFSTGEKAMDRQKESFRKEWHSTLTVLREIGDQLKENRPLWIEREIPIEWQIDQFLHAYYYNKVGDGKAKPFEDWYQNNKNDPQHSLNNALQWWKQLQTSPTDEEKTLYVSAPYIKDILREDRISSITTEELSKVFSYTHATKDHVIKLSAEMLGKPQGSYIDRGERLSLFSEWVLKQRNSQNWDIRELLRFVLYGGKDNDLWERLYLAGRTEKYSIKHYGLNSLAEVVGWARPEISPPRNGRTSKALRALGYDVRVY